MKTTALIAVLLLAASARAIELSLEENRGERGSVGYVDMQRLFTNSPDSQRAKEGFEELVRQAEERVNLRKAELLKLRQELDATRVERDALAHSMSLAPVPSTAAPAAALVPAVTPAPAVSTAAAPAAPAGPALSPAAQALIAASTAPAPARARELALPGMAATEPEPVSPPAAKPGVPSSDGAAAVPPAASTTTAKPAAAPAPAKPAVPSSDGAAAVPAVSSAAVRSAAGMFPAPPPAAPVAQAPAGPTPAQRLLELDAKIISLQADIAHKESELTQEHDEADRGLLDVESRKTDRVLASLYRAVSEVARREGVSVVIDKTTILYGHPAVDLTDKVLKYLEEKSKETPVP
ncbi:MAG TPA: OmpH family outer membrane protein [Elusimicrobiota bacterium]|nr:OmpH family outer membrane protein [Elusimicrobiota bacterium]